MDCIIAGSSFPCGTADLGHVAVRHGFSPTFIEHPHNAASTDAGLSPLRFETSLPEDLALRRGLFLPLLESWVSEGRMLPAREGLRFDRRAATISRSKHALSSVLAVAGVSHVPRCRVGTIEEALLAATACGYPSVLRPDAGYSGRGIWIASSAEDLRTFWAWQSKEREGADFAEMRSILDADDDVLIIEPWVSGNEWSVDCVVGPSDNQLIRICEKVTTIESGRPVTLGYRLTDSSDLVEELRQSVDRWCQLIFHRGEVSFACFDIRRQSNGDLVPVDFGVRLGGDCIPLLVRHAGQSRNAYAAAFDAILANDPRRIISLQAGHALVHAFAREPGTLAGLEVLGHGELINSRPLGFIIKQAEGKPICRRIATVLTHFNTSDEFIHACRPSSDWIKVSLS